uniref:Starch binding domain 1 n=1 Tax=Nothoprocta perdicaria TaxID=30464 RepID=A0A8C6ZJ53_NOTPE
MGAGLWPALLVALLAALAAWLWYGGADGRGERGGEAEEAAAAPHRAGLGAAGPPVRGPASTGSGFEGQGGLGPGPQEDLAAAARTELNHVHSDGASRKLAETEPLLARQPVGSQEHPNEASRSHVGEPRPQKGQASDGWCVMSLAEAPAEVRKDTGEELLGPPMESRDLDHEEWEVVSEHQAWGDTAKSSSTEDCDSKEWEQGDCPEGDLKAKRVAAVPPMFQNIHVTFRVHYITHSDAQLIGVTGDHECLGQWHSYVPLKYDKDGFWSESITLPVDTTLEWKFILVENGKVKRWEECSNRTLVTAHEDQMAHQWWGYH